MGAIEAARRVFEALRGPPGAKLLHLRKRRWTFHVERPTWKSDIRWISSADEATLECFSSLYQRLRIAERFSAFGPTTMLSGYFVARRHTRKSHFHTDFDDTGGGAYTLMSPLYEMSDLADCHLLCEVHPGEERHACYRYKVGQAIAFGDGFVHATETGDAGRELAFLCFTLGKQHMGKQHWQHAEYYISRQCPIYQSPDGQVVHSTEV